MAGTYEINCHVCGRRVDGGSPWIVFQTLWIMPGSKFVPVSLERATGQAFVSVHVKCVGMLIDGHIAGAERRRSTRKE